MVCLGWCTFNTLFMFPNAVFGSGRHTYTLSSYKNGILRLFVWWLLRECHLRTNPREGYVFECTPIQTDHCYKQIEHNKRCSHAAFKSSWTLLLACIYVDGAIFGGSLVRPDEWGNVLRNRILEEFKWHSKPISVNAHFYWFWNK